jgi:hypothetical protein
MSLAKYYLKQFMVTNRELNSKKGVTVILGEATGK